VFTTELAMFYKGFQSGQPIQAKPLPIQYADYAVWQREFLAGPEGERQMAYWRDVLGGMGSLPGAAIGAVLLGLAETLTATYVSLQWATVVPYALIVVVLLLRPQGLMGARLREDVAL
jgi:hypothetical protein